MKPHITKAKTEFRAKPQTPFSQTVRTELAPLRCANSVRTSWGCEPWSTELRLRKGSASKLRRTGDIRNSKKSTPAASFFLNCAYPPRGHQTAQQPTNLVDLKFR